MPILRYIYRGSPRHSPSVPKSCCCATDCSSILNWVSEISIISSKVYDISKKFLKIFLKMLKDISKQRNWNKSIIGTSYFSKNHKYDVVLISLINIIICLLTFSFIFLLFFCLSATFDKHFLREKYISGT